MKCIQRHIIVFFWIFILLTGVVSTPCHSAEQHGVLPDLRDNHPATNVPVEFFGDDLFTFPGSQPGTDQWYFSFTFKNVFHFAGTNWYYFREFNAYVYLTAANGSLADNFWAFMVYPDHSTWAYTGRGLFGDLRDSTGDGLPDLPDDEAGAQPLNGYIYLHESFTNDLTGSSWYYFGEYHDGNWMLQQDNPAAQWRFVAGGTDNTGPEGMVRVPGGTNSGTHPDFGSYSRTVEAFFMDRFEVTKEQWDIVYAWAIARGYQFDNTGSSKGPNHPVQMVNWFDCVKWLNARSEMEGLPPVYYLDEARTQVYRRYWVSDQLTVDANSQGYRLPTIAEREYAARGGVSSRRFSWADSDEIQHDRANYFSQGNVSYDTSLTQGHHPAYNDGVVPFTAPVGSFAPNGYGLYDMIGNVAEWCGQTAGSLSAICGGSWNTGPAGCRIGDRDFYDKFLTRNHVGFRAVRNVQQ